MMWLQYCTIKQLRMLADCQAQFCLGIHLIQGENGSGKTCLLEAIYWLATGKSFRTNCLDDLISYDQQVVSVQAGLQHSSLPNQRIAMLKYRGQAPHSSRDSVLIKRKHDWIKLIPVSYFGQEHYRLLVMSPQSRRSWFCWLACYLYPSYLSTWQDYQKSLKQRNALLRQSSDSSMIAAWENELARTANLLHPWHIQLSDCLQQQLQAELVRWNLPWPISWELNSGFKGEIDASLWQRGRDRDRLLGYTYDGPHRMDWQVRFNGLPARDVLSTGQQKILICCLFLARQELLYQQHVTPLLLIDDLLSELDNRFCALFLQRLQSLPGQIFVTVLDRYYHLADSAQATMWSLKQGKIISA